MRRGVLRVPSRSSGACWGRFPHNRTRAHPLEHVWAQRQSALSGTGASPAARGCSASTSGRLRSRAAVAASVRGRRGQIGSILRDLPRCIRGDRGPAVAAYTARQIPEDTTYLPSAAADGRCDCGARTEAAGGACRATACRRRGARAAQSTLPLSPDVFEWVSPSSVVRETSPARTTAPRRDP